MKQFILTMAFILSFVTGYAQGGYDPESPGDPSANMFNPTTGEAIVDRFTPGELYKTLRSLTGSKLSQISSLQVIGTMSESDFDVLYYLENCTFVDIGRTNGYNVIPRTCFFSISSLEEVVLPSCIDSIGNYAFFNCRNLSVITCYAVVPPTLSDAAFDGYGGKEGLGKDVVIKVPSGSIDLYKGAEGWKDHIILPIDESVYTLNVSLPDDAQDGRYKNMYLELVNAKSGQRVRYVITDRLTYAFSNIIKNTSWNVTLRNERGDVFGHIDNVEVKDQDVSIMFDSLSNPQNVMLRVLTPDGTDVTESSSITWLNEDGSLLANGAKACGVLEGTNVTYRIMLPQALAMQYRMPADVAYTVKDKGNEIECHLQEFEKISINGRILDVTTGQPLSGATVTVSQLLNGKYTKSVVTRSGNDGIFSINVLNEQSSMTVSAYNYLSQTTEYKDFSSNLQLGDISLKTITGTVISVNFTYTESVEVGQTAKSQDWYSDGANVTYSITNQTTNKPITDFCVQNGSIILFEEVAEGDILQITAMSKKAMFKDVIAQAVVDNCNRASVIFPIVELGSLKAYVSESENKGIVGILYDNKGVLLRRTMFSGDTLTINNLADGSYTLVSMGYSDFFNSVLNLSELTNAGLSEGRDFVSKEVVITSGVITRLDIASVPVFDESQFYYTSENTLFSANKSQVTIGNYITLKAMVDFKDEYATSVRDLKLVVDLPESCSFVENSVLTGNGMGGYEVAGNRITVNMNSLDDVVRFCIIPTAGGTCKPSAFVQFNYGGENILQPIGSAYFNAQNLAISVPSQTADSVVVVNGTAQTDCIVKVYDGNVLVGQTRSLANGRWSARVNLYKPYSHSFHNIYAEVGTANGQTLLTDTKLVEFDKTMTQLKTITMLYNGNTIVFDQIEGTTSTNTYSYVPSVHDFTFIARFTKNDTTLIKNLEFKVLASDGTIRRVSSTFSSRYNAWVGKATYDNSSRIPANVGVEYDYNSNPAIYGEDVDKDFSTIIDNMLSEVDNAYKNCAIEVLYQDDRSILLSATTNDYNSNEFFNITILDYDEVSKKYSNEFFSQIVNDTTNICFIIREESETVSNLIVWDHLDKMACEVFYTNTQVPSYSSIRRIIPFLLSAGFGVATSVFEYNLYMQEIASWYQHVNYERENRRKHYNTMLKLLYATCGDGSFKIKDPNIINFERGLADQWWNHTQEYLNEFQKLIEQEQLKLRQLCILKAIANVGLSGAGLILKGTGNLISNAAGWVSNTMTNLLARSANTAMTETASQLLSYCTGVLLGNQRPKEIISNWYSRESKAITSEYVEVVERIKASYSSCKKEEEDEEDDDEGKPREFATSPLSPSVDPSGYVYEGVPSNRLQGVKTTAYYKETVEDMYGDLHENIVKWDASEYAQENPLFTDENGMYQWDVPQGLWRVKFEKEGYETTYSEWLPVPPPQLEVNVGMVQSRQPEVKLVHAYKDGVEVEFDKYMQPALLNLENIMVSQNGEYVEGEVKLLNEEKAYADENVTYASKIRFVPATPFTADEVTLLVVNRVKSYAGLLMQDNYQQTFDIEKELTAIKADSAVNVAYEGALTLNIEVLPVEASAGKTVHIKSSSTMIVSVDEESITLDKNGKASVVVTGELPGAALLTYAIDGYDLSASTIVNVDIVAITACAVPTASLATGSIVESGTAIELFCATEGATIYYTLDGSCPCNDTESRKIYDGTPIVINQSVTIKAMAVAPDMYESEVVEFTFLVESVSTDEVTINDQIEIYPLPVREKLNVAAGGKTIKNVVVSSTNGVIVAKSSHAAPKITMDFSKVPTGIYIVNVVTEDGTIRRKIQKIE